MGRWCGKPATNHLSYGKACPYMLLGEKHHFKTYYHTVHHVHVSNHVGLFVKTKSKT
jgi:hypothetical protein